MCHLWLVMEYMVWEVNSHSTTHNSQPIEFLIYFFFNFEIVSQCSLSHPGTHL